MGCRARERSRECVRKRLLSCFRAADKSLDAHSGRAVKRKPFGEDESGPAARNALCRRSCCPGDVTANRQPVGGYVGVARRSPSASARGSGSSERPASAPASFPASSAPTRRIFVTSPFQTRTGLASASRVLAAAACSRRSFTTQPARAPVQATLLPDPRLVGSRRASRRARHPSPTPRSAST